MKTYLLFLASIGLIIDFFRLSYGRLFEIKGPGFISGLFLTSYPIALVCLFVGSILIDVMDVPSSSMLPSIEVDDKIYVNRQAYNSNWPTFDKGTAEPQIGEVIVMKFPLNTDIHYVKLLLGKEGDTVIINEDAITVNSGVYPLHKSDTPRLYRVSHDNEVLMDEYRVAINGYDHVLLKKSGTAISETKQKVPHGGVFVIGTNLDYSGDSRDMGPLSASLIVGRKI